MCLSMWLCVPDYHYSPFYKSVGVCLCLVVYLHVHNINVHIRLPLVPCQFTRSLFLLTVLRSMAEIPI